MKKSSPTPPAATREHNWTSVEPKFSRGRVAKALELKAAGKSLREIQERTGIHYSYVCKLAKNVADEVIPTQLQSERARKVAITLLLREKTKLETRLGKVNKALVRYGAGEPTPTEPPTE